MTEVVLDASAFLAVAKREPGAERVVAARDRAVMSAVNATEVYAKLLAGGMTEDEVAAGLRTVVRRIVPFDEPQARAAGVIHTQSRAFGLSLADCACLALGGTREALVLTADRDWTKIALGVTVESIR